MPGEHLRSAMLDFRTGLNRRGVPDFVGVKSRILIASSGDDSVCLTRGRAKHGSIPGV